MPSGSKPGERRGGRQKGTRNRASLAREARISSTGATPLDVMIRKMRWHLSKADREIAKGDAADLPTLELAFDKANEAAKDAAPYTHPRLAAIEHMGKGGGPIEYSDVRDRLAHLLAREAAAAEPAEDHPTAH